MQHAWQRIHSTGTSMSHPSTESKLISNAFNILWWRSAYQFLKNLWTTGWISADKMIWGQYLSWQELCKLDSSFNNEQYNATFVLRILACTFDLSYKYLCLASIVHFQIDSCRTMILNHPTVPSYRWILSTTSRLWSTLIIGKRKNYNWHDGLQLAIVQEKSAGWLIELV